MVEKAPPHEKAASVNEIIKVVGENKIYNYTYWLRRIGNVSYGNILSILKDLQTLPEKYSKGATLTNILLKINGFTPRKNTQTKKETNL